MGIAALSISHVYIVFHRAQLRLWVDMVSNTPVAPANGQITSPPPYEPWPASHPTANAPADAVPVDRDETNAMDIDSNGADDRDSRAPSTLSIDDLEVAKALTGMREGTFCDPKVRGGFVQADLSSSLLLASPTASSSNPSSQNAAHAQHPEPLLTLLTSQHPLVANAINGSLSAYTSSKSFSPRFKVGAEFVERNIALPVASTVGTAGRISGVESGVRWLLQRRDSSPGTPPRGSKRRRVDDDDDSNIDPRLAHSTPRDAMARPRAVSDMSQAETLPAYDDQHSPAYEEKASNATTAPQTWQTRLVMTTSALGVAMSDESLRSLKFCLSWLRWANHHLGGALSSLQVVLREWEESQKQTNGEHDDSTANGATTGGPDAARPRDPHTIAQHLQALKAECLKTLRNALDVVSTYAGGALPENARGLVRGHLVSLPRRFQIASSSMQASPAPTARGPGDDDDAERQAPAPEAVTGARRVVVLTREGLDMIAQVGAVVDSVIVEAECWCDRLGRRVHGQAEGPDAGPEPAGEKQEMMPQRPAEQEPLLAEKREQIPRDEQHVNGAMEVDEKY